MVHFTADIIWDWVTEKGNKSSEILNLKSFQPLLLVSELEARPLRPDPSTAGWRPANGPGPDARPLPQDSRVDAGGRTGGRLTKVLSEARSTDYLCLLMCQYTFCRLRNPSPQ